MQGVGKIQLGKSLWEGCLDELLHIFTDEDYVKPYLVVYMSTSSFTIYLVPWAIKRGLKHPAVRRKLRLEPLRGSKSGLDTRYTRLEEPDDDGADEEQEDPHRKLNTRETMRLSAQFCLLWFVANWFASACLEHTSVASVTILSATSSIFTLVFGALFRVERFSWVKLAGITVSLTGVALISKADATKGSDASEAAPTNGEKTHTVAEILLGDGMALMGALCYGLYTVLLKVKIGHESRISMQLFFGFVAVWWVIAINSSITVISDFCWVFAMMYTTPVIVTVGLSLSIPIALFGDMIISGLKLTWTYWFGACLVFGAFFVVNNSVEDDELLDVAGSAAAAGAGSAAVLEEDADVEADRRRGGLFGR
ncbi:hypothetical protein ABW19_dt0202808 [Dactylella cylindrospora]|nr:hypothetical protein ABW19_dt0202808 [Dactylella cylindrospora]